MPLPLQFDPAWFPWLVAGFGLALLINVGVFVYLGFGAVRRFATGFAMWTIYYTCFQTLRSVDNWPWLWETARALWERFASSSPS